MRGPDRISFEYVFPRFRPGSSPSLAENLLRRGKDWSGLWEKIELENIELDVSAGTVSDEEGRWCLERRMRRQR